MRSQPGLACWLCVLLSWSARAANVCNVVEGQDHYDLSALSSPKDWEVSDARNGTILLNICRSINSEVWKIDDPSQVGIYRRGESGGESLGAVHNDPVVLPSPKGEPGLHALSVTYPEGSRCPSGGSYSSVLLLTCDTAVYGEGHPILVGSSSDGCAHFLSWRTPAACPKPPSRGILSAILVFLAVGLIAVIVFFGSSVAYVRLLFSFGLFLTMYKNRLVLNKRGFEAFPPAPGQQSQGGFFGGFADRLRSFTDRFRSRDRAYFQGLPTDPNESANLFDDISDDEDEHR